MVTSPAKALLIGASVGLLGAALSLAPPVLDLEQNAGLDWLFARRGPVAAPDVAAVVSIDTASAESLGLHPDPDRWPRSLHARLIERLTAAGAAVIAFDLMFDAPRELAEDRALAAAIAAAGRVILLERLRSESIATGAGRPALQKESRVPPIPSLERAALAAGPFPLPVVPYKVSQYWTFSRSEPTVATLPALALHAFALGAHDEFVALLQSLVPERTIDVPSRAEIVANGTLAAAMSRIRALLVDDPALGRRLASAFGDRTAPAEASGQPRGALLQALTYLYIGPQSRYINYYGTARAIRTIPYHEILAPDWDPAAAGLAGTAVFVGYSERNPPEQQDTFYSPYSERTGINLSGVEIGATAFANLLTQRSVRPTTMLHTVALAIVWGCLLTVALLLLPIWAGLPVAGLAGAGYAWIAVASFTATGLWMPVLVTLAVQLPVAMLVAAWWKYGRARAHGDRVGRALEHYLPVWVTDDVARDSAHVGGATRLMHGACVVTDAAQYTALSERCEPHALHALLNDYYAVLFRAVERYGGVVTDVVGDSMVAVWVSEQPDTATIERACMASLAILDGIAEFNAADDRPGLPTRIGIHAGAILLGDVGAESHFEYRAVGDSVNTASRVQAVNKRLGTRLLVSSDVAAAIAATCPSRFVGSFELAGKRDPVALFELLGRESFASPCQRDGIRSFAAALEAYRARRWSDAIAELDRVLARVPDDGPSQFYRRLCTELMRNEPAADWHGTVVMSQA